MGISGTFLALRSRVAGFGFFGLGVGVATGVAAGLVELLGEGFSADGAGAESNGLDCGDADSAGVANVSDPDPESDPDPDPDPDSEAVAFVELPLTTPMMPPATSATARRAMTGRRKRGSFTPTVCHEIHKTCVVMGPRPKGM